jgi:hypothetical protein
MIAPRNPPNPPLYRPTINDVVYFLPTKAKSLPTMHSIGIVKSVGFQLEATIALPSLDGRFVGILSTSVTTLVQSTDNALSDQIRKLIKGRPEVQLP